MKYLIIRNRELLAKEKTKEIKQKVENLNLKNEIIVLLNILNPQILCMTAVLLSQHNTIAIFDFVKRKGIIISSKDSNYNIGDEIEVDLQDKNNFVFLD